MSFYTKLSDTPYAVMISPKLLGERLSAISYNNDFLGFMQAVANSDLTFVNLGEYFDISAMVGWKNLTTEDYVNQGVRMLRVVDIRERFVSLESTVQVSPAKVQEQPQIHLKAGDIVYSKDGTLGIAAIVPDVKELICAGSTLARVRIKKHSTKILDPYFVVAFLNCEFAQSQVSYYTNGIAQPHITQEYIYKLRIPIPDPKIQAYIGDKVRLAERCREEAGRLIEQAKADLVSTLSFDLYTPPSTSSSSGSGYRLLGIKPGCILVESVLIGNSLLPTRYQAQYLDRDMLLVDHGLELISLEDIASGFINGFDCRDFKSSGTPYLRVGNIRPNELDLSGVMYIEIQPTSLPKKFHLTSGDLLITRKGSYGFCTSVTKEMEQMVFSSEIIRVPLHKGWDADYIALFLNSPYGRYQFDRLGTGTTMKGINHENLADIKVPEVSYEAQKIIGGKVRLSMALNEKSKDLISEACRDVEDLIDAGLVTASILSGEMQAPTWNEVHQNLLTNLSYA